MAKDEEELDLYEKVLLEQEGRNARPFESPVLRDYRERMIKSSEEEYLTPEQREKKPETRKPSETYPEYMFRLANERYGIRDRE